MDPLLVPVFNETNTQIISGFLSSLSLSLFMCPFVNIFFFPRPPLLTALSRVVELVKRTFVSFLSRKKKGTQ
jgi:hypothetical protein